MTVLLFLFCSLGFTRVSAQDQVFIDSLLSIIDSNPSDTIKVESYRKITWHLIQYDLELAEEYAYKVREVGSRVDSLLYNARSDYYLGLIHRLRGELLESLDYFQSVESYYGSDTMHYVPLINTYYQLGVVYGQLDMHEEALSYLLKELDYAIEVDHKDRIANNLNSIGVVYKHMEYYDRAIEYYDRAIAIAEEGGHKIILTHATVNKAKILQSQGNCTEALPLLEKGLQIDRELDYVRGIVQCLETMALCHSDARNLDKAQSMLEQAVALSDSLEAKDLIASTTVSLSGLLLDAGQYAKGYQWSQRALIASEDFGGLHNRNTALGIHAELCEKLGKYAEAVKYLRQREVVQDSLTDEQRIKEANQMEARFRLERSQEEIAKLTLTNTNNLLVLDKQKSQKRNLLIGLGTLLFISVLVARVLHYRVQAKELQVAHQETLNEQLIHENQMLALTAMLEGQEEERNRIAQDLHDGLGGLLATIRIHYQNLQSELKKLQNLKIYEFTAGLIDEACHEVRRISHDMMPAALKMDGLTSAVEDLCISMHHDNFYCHSEIMGDEVHLSPQKSLMLYRVIQELCHNVQKHAGASELIVQLHYLSDVLNVLVEDNGGGFHVGKEGKGIGLKSVYSRVEYLHGKIEIDSKIDVGTSVHIEVPLEENM